MIKGVYFQQCINQMNIWTIVYSHRSGRHSSLYCTM